jgi:[NiFe] hydrogenase maturation protein HypF
MRITISGTVQGVGFRPAVHRTAVSLGLNGRVWNDGSDVVVEIDNADIFLEGLMKGLPPLASVSAVVKEDVPFDRNIKGFSIVRSAEGKGGVSIPTDTAICEYCLNDMKNGRRKGYEFTSCTGCGARFTLLSDMPYDRNNTSMKEFEMCSKCRKEYENPNDRRFHHQTICCPECGPKYRLLDKNGRSVKGDVVKGFTDILKAGGIGIVKSWGGMHICCVPENVRKMREWYGRPQKPFALMVRDREAIWDHAEPNDKELEHVTSAHRPIVLMKKVNSKITECISPGLDNIGIFLPYTGMQHLLFSHAGNGLIMTSANLPGEPMLLDDSEVLELGADAYLLHDQRIMNRADDSVLRVNSGRTAFIRKSRGHIPSSVGILTKGCAIGLGAQENLTASIAYNGRIHSTQHIGDGDSLGVPEYLEEAVRSMKGMMKCDPQMIVTDKHPGYSNKALGKKLAQEFSCPLMEVQHHWAHAASLLVDNKEDDAVVLTLDGTGYGDDGNAWGGEIMYSSLEKYERLAHLQNIPLLGSEKALYDLRRLKFAVDMINGIESKYFNERDSEILRKMAPKSVLTSSFGRLLDTLAFTLGVCEKRTYDGEPAMKMEPLLSSGRLIPGFETEMQGKEIMTADLFRRIEKEKREDVAYSVVNNIISVMVDTACDHAGSFGTKNIGLTGGVSYSRPICEMVSQKVKKRGFGLILHNSVPNGDGGISVGQAAIASKVMD